MPSTVQPAPAAGSGPVSVVAGPQYGAGPIRRWLLGDRYRDLWTTPVRVSVLDPARYRGGLTPVREGGGFETLSLHLRDAEGRYYLFRSVDKWMNQGLGPDLRNTPAGWIIQDQTKALHPAGALPVSALLRAVGDVPYTVPELYVLGDDPILGQYRARYAGMLGTLVESPDDGPEHDLHFEGSDQVLSSEDLLKLVAATPAHRIDDRALLKARLVDLLIGDFDRGFGQWRWLRFGPDSAWTWVGSPLDRDDAFIEADGLAGFVGRRIERKYVQLTEEIDVRGLLTSTEEVDRLVFAGIDRRTWDSIASRVQAAIGDDVIRAAVDSLPPEYRAGSGDVIAGKLAARRDRLLDAARRFYVALAEMVDVQATDADELAEIERSADGAVTVTLYGPRGAPRVLTGADGATAAAPAADVRRRFVPEDA
jgi:hypothetical protein